jgi:hypothetical protein
MSSGWRRTVTAAVLPSATHLGLRLSKHCSRSGLARVRLQWVGSGSSSRALERSLSNIKLMFTWQGSLGPRQSISVAVPKRAIAVAG